MLAKLFVNRSNYEAALNTLDEAQEIYSGIELEYCRSICFMNLGQGDYGKTMLKNLLAEDYSAHEIMFDFDLNKDAKAQLTELIQQFGF